MKTKKATRAYNARNLWASNFKIVELTTLKTIFRKFIEPCIQNWIPTPEQTAMHHGIRWVMDVDRRPIYCCKVKKGFQIPGQSKHPDTAALYVPPLALRKLRKGHQLWVRFNDFTPDIIEAEVDHSGIVFQMNKAQWESIKGNLLHVG